MVIVKDCDRQDRMEVGPLGDYDIPRLSLGRRVTRSVEPEDAGDDHESVAVPCGARPHPRSPPGPWAPRRWGVTDSRGTLGQRGRRRWDARRMSSEQLVPSRGPAGGTPRDLPGALPAEVLRRARRRFLAGERLDMS